MTDFAPGDVVVCVDASPHFDIYRDPPRFSGLVLGKYYTVLGVDRVPDGDGEIGLYVSGTLVEKSWGWADSFAASRFRKLRAADEQFTEQMRALRPAKEPVK